MWIDDRQCEDRFHLIEKKDGEWVVLHSDGEECLVVEFDVSELVEG